MQCAISQTTNIIDIETTGLDETVNQLRQIAVVQVVDGVLKRDNEFNVHIRNPRVTFSTDYLEKFGVPTIPKEAVSLHEAGIKLADWLSINTNKNQSFCGKNIGYFDIQWMNHYFPLMQFGYQFWDIGNLFGLPGIDNRPPNLDKCITRGNELIKVCKLDIEQYPYLNTPVQHDALKDALQCANLYSLWYTDGHRLREIPSASNQVRESVKAGS